jgi:hypothetical protein
MTAAAAIALASAMILVLVTVPASPELAVVDEAPAERASVHPGALVGVSLDQLYAAAVSVTTARALPPAARRRRRVPRRIHGDDLKDRPGSANPRR